MTNKLIHDQAERERALARLKGRLDECDDGDLGFALDAIDDLERQVGVLGKVFKEAKNVRAIEKMREQLYGEEDQDENRIGESSVELAVALTLLEEAISAVDANPALAARVGGQA